jgi:coenzyme F420 hydrogenase subunit beta
MSPNVISTIVKKDLCIGCGLCAAICPEHSLVMQFNKFGEYNPARNKECLKECGLCLKVCPFADGNDNEDILGKTLYGSIPGICHCSEMGYFLDSYVGYSPETRCRGASGGMATWLLSTLVNQGIVDHVIAVVPDEDPDRLFRFAILSDPASVMASSGSVYYPVELSGVLQEIRNKPGKYVVIGLPCYIKALRLAVQRNRELKERIVFMFGLVCGQMKSTYYTDYLSVLSGVIPPLKKVYYRGKSSKKPSSFFYYFSENNNGDTGKVFYNEGVSRVWSNRWFTLNACNYCDDIFAECADAVFMDAWLPEYINDYKGVNLLLVRSAAVKEIIDEGIRSGKICLDHIPVQELIESQEGIIHDKKDHLAYQLYLNLKKGVSSPVKRVAPKNIWMAPFQKREVELKEQMRVISRDVWAKEKRNMTYNKEKIDRAMAHRLNQLMAGRKILNIFNFPVKVYRFMQRKIRSRLHG